MSKVVKMSGEFIFKYKTYLLYYMFFYATPRIHAVGKQSELG